MNNFKIIIAMFLSFVLTNKSSYSQDWANISRFKNENLKLTTPTKAEKRVVFMGNSITEGWIKIRPSFFESKPYINRGIGGQTTPQMLVRFRADVINLKPALVVILAGTNDIAGNTGPSTLQMVKDNIVSMVQLAEANGIKVILCSILPVFDYPWKQGLNPAENIFALNSMLKDFAKKNKLGYVDFYTPMADDRKGLKIELSEDGVHPNEKGYLIMEPLVEKAIKDTLGK